MRASCALFTLAAAALSGIAAAQPLVMPYYGTVAPAPYLYGYGSTWAGAACYGYGCVAASDIRIAIRREQRFEALRESRPNVPVPAPRAVPPPTPASQIQPAYRDASQIRPEFEAATEPPQR